MIFRKAVKDDFDNIKSLYWELIDQEQGDPSFPHWKKGIHPSDEMLHNSIDKKELYMDYMEWCPKEVYDNPSNPEDVW